MPKKIAAVGFLLVTLVGSFAVIMLLVGMPIPDWMKQIGLAGILIVLFSGIHAIALAALKFFRGGDSSPP